MGDGNGNALQYSFLDNPVDRGAWWAAVQGVTQSQTWLKWLSMQACIGEGHGNPLQCSCLENPRDRGAWWAVVCGVAQSRTRLKRLSSSSNHWQISIYHIRHCFSYPKSTRISVSVDFEILCVLKNFRDGMWSRIPEEEETGVSRAEGLVPGHGAIC